MSRLKLLTFAKVAILNAFAFTTSTMPVNAGDGVVELLHVWRTESELNALDVYRTRLEERGIKWLDEAVSGNAAALQYELSTRIAHSVPPGIVQWIVGDTLTQLVDDHVFKNIPVYNQEMIRRLEPEVLSLIQYKDGLSAVPLGIHVQNYVVYNQDILDRYDLKPPQTWSELISYGPILARDNISLIVWGDQQWQVRQLVISIMASLLTPEQFTRLQNNNVDVQDLREEITRAYEIYTELRKYNGMNDQADDWEVVSHKVMNGKALGQILGDFLVPEMASRGAVLCALPPENEYIVWGLDTFALVELEDRALQVGQDAFVEIAFDIPTNIKYVQAKGGIPVLRGIEPSELGSCHAANLKRWNEATVRVFSGSDQWRMRLGVISELFMADATKPSQSAEKAVDELMKVLMNF